MTTYRPHFNQHQPGIVTGYMRTDEMNVKDLEAKCRVKIALGKSVTANAKLILQLIEERRLLARFCENDFSMTKVDYLNACALRDRVLQEIAECKST